MPSRSSARTPRLRFFGALTIAAVVALTGCGGGGSSAPVAAPAPLAVSGDANFSVTQTIALSAAPGSGTTTVALPSASTVTGAVSFPAPLAPVNALLSETMQNSAPSADGIPALAAGRRLQGALGIRAASTSTTLIYLRLVVSQVVQLPGSPSFSFTVSAANLVPGATYYIAAFDDVAHPRDWDIGWEGPATVNATILTFPGNAGAFTFAAGVKYWFALIAVGAPLATPSPAPSPTGSATPGPTNAPSAAPTSVPTAIPTSTPAPTVTPTPMPTPTVTPTVRPTATPTARPTATPAPTASPAPGPLNVVPYPTVNIVDVGAANAQTVTVSESPYAVALSFSESDTCSPPSGTIATIATANPHGPSASYTVTGVVPGTCMVTFSDAFAQSKTVSIVVTTTRVTIEGRRR